MHPEARKSMERKIKGVLKNATVTKGMLDLSDQEAFSKALHEFMDEVVKQKGRWITYTNSIRILIRQVSKSMAASFEDHYVVSGNLRDILQDDKFKQLCTDIMDYLKSIPRTYTILFELPVMKPLGIKEIPLTPNISFLEVETNDYPEIISPSSGLGLLQRLKDNVPVKGKLYIRILCDGYAEGNIESSAVNKAYSIFKQVILLGKNEGILQDTQVSMGLLERHKAKVLVYYNEDRNVEKYELNLPENANKFIEKLGINQELLKPDTLETYMMKAEFENIDDLTPKDKAKLFIKRFNHPIQLLKTSDDDKNAERIKTAIEWGFESVTNENDTFAFIQACIGLEALLGDETVQEILTKTLADRCAYLIAKSIENRKKVKNNFVDLYAVRSKLIHGHKPKLTQDEQRYLGYAQSVLKRAIRAEINNLE